MLYQIQVLFCLFCVAQLGSAQCPTNFIYSNGQCVPQNVTQCANGQLYGCGSTIVNVFVNGAQTQTQTFVCHPGQQCQPQPTPCPNQPVSQYPIVIPQPNPCPADTTPPGTVTTPNPCPNQPVTPYPNLVPQSTPATLTETTPNPCPNQPVTPYPNLVPQSTPATITETTPNPCPNQPVTPYPNLVPQSTPATLTETTPNPCPNQPVTPYPNLVPQSTPATITETTPNPCPNQPVTPYPNLVPQSTPATLTATTPNPCPNQPVTPYPNLVPQSTPATSVETTPNPNLVPQSTPETATDTQTSQPDAELVPQSTPPGATTESTAMSPTTVATTNEPRPEPITQCPKGTILVGGKCHLVYCGVYELSDEHCARLQCPAGTIWTGQKCARPAPIEIEPIHLERTITVVNDKNEPNLVLNNVHNLVINASISLTPAESEYEDESEEAAAEPAAKCCTVLGPRTCRYDAQSSRWQCFNRKQNQCGDFCSAPKVMLIPATVTTWSYNNAQMLVMPPPPNNVVTGINNSSYDCSGCAAGALMSCSPYCYNSACSSPYCAYYAQAQFCQTQAVGSVGCCPEDGWPVSSSEPKD